MCASTKLLFCFVTRHHVFAPRSFCTYRCCTRFPWVNTIAFAIQPPQPDALAWNRHTVQNASLPYFLFARASSAQHGLNLFGILRRLPASKGSFVFVGANIKLRIVHILHHAAKTDQCSLAHSIDANIVDLRDLLARYVRKQNEVTTRMRIERTIMTTKEPNASFSSFIYAKNKVNQLCRGAPFRALRVRRALPQKRRRPPSRRRRLVPKFRLQRQKAQRRCPGGRRHTMGSSETFLRCSEPPVVACLVDSSGQRAFSYCRRWPVGLLRCTVNGGL